MLSTWPHKLLIAAIVPPAEELKLALPSGIGAACQYWMSPNSLYNSVTCVEVRAGEINGCRTLTPWARIHMLTHMRTTLIIDDDLLRQAKLRAAEWNQTVSDVVNNALRECLGRPIPTAPPFSLITYGRSNRPVHHEPAEFNDALEQEDKDRLRR